MTRHTAAGSRRWSDVPCPRPSGRRQGHRPPGVLPGVRTRAARTRHTWCRMGLPRRLHPHGRGIGSLGTSTRDLNSLLRLGPMRPRPDGVRLHGSVRWRGDQLRVGPLPCLVSALPLAAVAALVASTGSGQLSGLRSGVPGRVSAGGYHTLQQAHHTESPARGEERARSINPANQGTSRPCPCPGSRRAGHRHWSSGARRERGMTDRKSCRACAPHDATRILSVTYVPLLPLYRVKGRIRALRGRKMKWE